MRWLHEHDFIEWPPKHLYRLRIIQESCRVYGSSVLDPRRAESTSCDGRFPRNTGNIFRREMNTRPFLFSHNEALREAPTDREFVNVPIQSYSSPRIAKHVGKATTPLAPMICTRKHKSNSNGNGREGILIDSNPLKSLIYGNREMRSAVHCKIGRMQPILSLSY